MLLERLEPRHLLACSIGLDNGVVAVTGDQSDNVVEARGRSDILAVRCYERGDEAPRFTSFESVHALRMDLLGGNDDVDVQFAAYVNVHSFGLTIDTGDDQDSVQIQMNHTDLDSLTKLAVQVNLGEGADLAVFRSHSNALPRELTLDVEAGSTSFIPESGDTVVVEFVQGATDHPFKLGAVYHGHDAPANPGPESKVLSLRVGADGLSTEVAWNVHGTSAADDLNLEIAGLPAKSTSVSVDADVDLGAGQNTHAAEYILPGVFVDELSVHSSVISNDTEVTFQANGPVQSPRFTMFVDNGTRLRSSVDIGLNAAGFEEAGFEITRDGFIAASGTAKGEVGVEEVVLVYEAFERGDDSRPSGQETLSLDAVAESVEFDLSGIDASGDRLRAKGAMTALGHPGHLAMDASDAWNPEASADAEETRLQFSAENATTAGLDLQGSDEHLRLDVKDERDPAALSSRETSLAAIDFRRSGGQRVVTTTVRNHTEVAATYNLRGRLDDHVETIVVHNEQLNNKYAEHMKHEVGGGNNVVQIVSKDLNELPHESESSYEITTGDDEAQPQQNAFSIGWDNVEVVSLAFNGHGTADARKESSREATRYQVNIEAANASQTRLQTELPDLQAKLQIEPSVDRVRFEASQGEADFVITNSPRTIHAIRKKTQKKTASATPILNFSLKEDATTTDSPTVQIEFESIGNDETDFEMLEPDRFIMIEAHDDNSPDGPGRLTTDFEIGGTRSSHGAPSIDIETKKLERMVTRSKGEQSMALSMDGDDGERLTLTADVRSVDVQAEMTGERSSVSAVLQLTGSGTPAVVSARGFDRNDIAIMGSDAKRGDKAFVRLAPSVDSARESKITLQGSPGPDVFGVSVEGKLSSRVRIVENGNQGNDWLMVDTQEALVAEGGRLVVRQRGAAGNDGLSFLGPAVNHGKIDVLQEEGAGDGFAAAWMEFTPDSRGEVVARTAGNEGADVLAMVVSGGDPRQQTLVLDGGGGLDSCAATDNVLEENCEDLFDVSELELGFLEVSPEFGGLRYIKPFRPDALD